MFKTSWQGRPKPAERPRTRFSKDKKSFYVYNPPSHYLYQQELIRFFSQFKEEHSLVELFEKRHIVYGLSVKLIFRLKSKGENPFYGKRPDIDNLYKAVIDALFLSEVNQVEDGFLTDKEGNPIFDKKGNQEIKYKQKIDDSRVIHTEILKLRVDSAEEEGFTLVIRNVGKEDIE